MNALDNVPMQARAAWIPADNSNKRTKGQWHQWISEAFTFFLQMRHR